METGPAPPPVGMPAIMPTGQDSEGGWPSIPHGLGSDRRSHNCKYNRKCRSGSSACTKINPIAASCNVGSPVQTPGFCFVENRQRVQVFLQRMDFHLLTRDQVEVELPQWNERHGFIERAVQQVRIVAHLVEAASCTSL